MPSDFDFLNITRPKHDFGGKALWTQEEILSAIKAPTPFLFFNKTEPIFCTNVCIDSRILEKGDLFIALNRGRSDGHAFVNDAFKKGAAAAVVSRTDQQFHGPVFMVKDTYEALIQLAQAARARFKGKILALTGSVGKTTTKEALYHALLRQCDGDTPPYCALGPFNNFNNALGVSFLLARMPHDAPYALFELGMNHANEIDYLSSLVKPDIACVLNVSLQHAAHFDGVASIAKAKAEIFLHCQSAIGILNQDCPHAPLIRTLGEQAGVKSWITFGSSQKASLRLIDQVWKNGVLQTTIQTGSQQQTYTTHGWCHHWGQISLAVASCMDALGKNPMQALSDLTSFPAIAGRENKLVINDITLIDGSYNAAPVAMQSVLKALYEKTRHLEKSAGREHQVDDTLSARGKIYLALGAMKELGPISEKEHEALAPLMEKISPDYTWLCGQEWTSTSLVLRCPHGLYRNVSDLIPDILSTIKPWDILLIKGGHSCRMFKIIDALYRAHNMNSQADNYPMYRYL